MMNGSFTVSQNALVAHKLTQMRQGQGALTVSQYRQLMRQISLLLVSEVTAFLPTRQQIEFTGPGWRAFGTLLGDDPVIVPVLRTGLIMAEAFQDIMPQTLTGHIGLHRDKRLPDRNLIEYLVSLPDLTGRLLFLLDPVVATGDTAWRAIDIVKQHGAMEIVFVCLVISKEARERFSDERGEHCDVSFHCAAEDPIVDKHTGRVLPGLGSVSERLFGFDPD